MKNKQIDFNHNGEDFKNLEVSSGANNHCPVPASLQHVSEQNFSLRELFHGVFSKLHPLFSIDCGALIIYDDELNHISKVYLSEASDGEISCVETVSDPISLSLITKEISGFDFPVLKSRQDWIEDFGENHCLNYHPTEYHFHCYIPIEHTGKKLGTFELHNHNRELSPDGLTFCCNIADFLAGLLAVMDKRIEVLRPVNQNLNPTEKLFLSEQLLNQLERATAIDEVVSIVENALLSNLKADFVEFSIVNQQDFAFDPESLNSVINSFEVRRLNEPIVKIEKLNVLLKREIESVFVIPLVKSNTILGQLLIGFKEPEPLNFKLAAEINLTRSIILLNVESFLLKEKNKLQEKEIQEYQEKMSEYLVHKIEVPSENYRYDDIVGVSEEMQQVYRLLNRISSSETTVLILGETGTGKELIAKAVHDASRRKSNKMIRVNCAAIPPNLIESELFGHEKGSFTGATERRIGKFEQAHNSTIFLDEVGELPLDLQVKLLRVLQEKEIERVGGKTTISTDVRIVSATNRNLLEEVEAGRFRRDLFYRLNVFPVSLPPLRNRKMDIPVLATHFLNKYATKSNKTLYGFSKKAVSAMMAYNWPGNVRELEHLIEREVVMAKGLIIKDIEVPNASKKSVSLTGTSVKTIFENEREHIFSVLKLCNGKISGPNGAAKLLGVPATTLNSKIKKLGLAKKHVF